MSDDATRRTGAQIPVSSGKPFKGLVAERWELLEPIGEGGMSDVYRARHVIMNKIGAVKFLKGELASDPVAVKRFEQEATASSSLSHKNIVQVHDCGVSEHGMYIILEFLEGLSLCDVLDDRAEQAEDGRGKLSVEEALPIFIQVLDGLDHAHKKGVVHRDMKPSNIMLVTDNEGVAVKIVDFGIAKLLENTDGGLTRPGEVFGSPLYMSPEQCLGKGLDGRSDVYSVGCMMYEALTGKRLFYGRNPTETMMKHVQESADLTTLARLEHNLSDALVAIISKSTAKDKNERFESAAAMRDALMELSQSLSPQGKTGKQRQSRASNASAAKESQSPASERLKPVLIGSVIGLLLVVTLFAAACAYSFMPVASSAALTRVLAETVYVPKWQPAKLPNDERSTVKILKADHLIGFCRPDGGWQDIAKLENFVKQVMYGISLSAGRNEFYRASTMCKDLLKDLQKALDPDESIGKLVLAEGTDSEIFRTVRTQLLQTLTLYTFCNDALVHHPSPRIPQSELKRRIASGEEMLDTQVNSKDLEKICEPQAVIDAYCQTITLLDQKGDRKDSRVMTRQLLDFWYKQTVQGDVLSERGLYQAYLADLYRMSGEPETSSAFARAIVDLKGGQFGSKNNSEKELLANIYLRFGVALKERAARVPDDDKKISKDAFNQFNQAVILFCQVGNSEMAKASKGEAYTVLKSYDPLKALVFRLQNGV